jgi:hypothetical protein
MACSASLQADELATVDAKAQPGGGKTNEQRIRGALDDGTELEFVETPLTDVVEYLKDLHKIEIQLDAKSLEDAGKGSDTPVTENLKGLKLKSALNLLLRKHDLTWIIHNEVLFITTPEYAASLVECRLYDVRDLAGERESADSKAILESLATTIRTAIMPQSWSNAGGNGTMSLYLHNGICALVISQTHEAHSRIENLLTDLRKLNARAKPVAIEKRTAS